MPQRKPWTRASLHRHLFKLLERPTTSLQYGTIKKGIAARVEFDDHFPPLSISLTVDANNTPVVQYVIHELIHVIISELVLGKFDETLEEVIVVALDQYVFAYVNSSKARLAKWNALIERKLAEKPTTPTPHEELVKRGEAS